MGRPMLAAVAGASRALSAGGAGWLAGPGQSRLERAGARAPRSIIADNGIHADIMMPVDGAGAGLGAAHPESDFAAADPNAGWIAFGSGEQRVYLDTPTWWDITPRTIWSALAGGKRVMHVEYVPSPRYAVREIRLRPEEYRRLVGGDPRRLRARCATAGRSASPIPATAAATLSTGPPARRARSDLQQLGRRPPAARRSENQPLAAVRSGADLALPEDSQST